MFYKTIIRNVPVKPNKTIDLDFFYKTDTPLNGSAYQEAVDLAREKVTSFFKENDYSKLFPIESIWIDFTLDKCSLRFKAD